MVQLINAWVVVIDETAGPDVRFAGDVYFPLGVIETAPEYEGLLIDSSELSVVPILQ